jgi:hypothetical protein
LVKNELIASARAALVANVRIVKTAFGATRRVDRVVFGTWIWRG